MTGRIRELSGAPIPGSVSYKEHVVCLHLTELARPDGQPVTAPNALVAMYSMRDNVWTQAARYRRGELVHLKLRNYDMVDDVPNTLTYRGSGPEVGAREAGTTRSFGGAASTCP